MNHLPSLLVNPKYKSYLERYLPVVCILVIFFCYNSFILNKELESDDSLLKTEKGKKADISETSKEKVFKNIFHSKEGDFFRLDIEVLTSNEMTLTFSVVSIFGDEKEVGEIRIVEDTLVHKDLVFGTDDIYTDLIVREKKSPDSSSFYKNEAYIESLALSPLSVKTEDEARALQPIRFEQERPILLLPRFFNEGIKQDALSKSNSAISEVFQSSHDYLSSIELDLLVIGNGGNGRYEISLSEYDVEKKQRGKQLEKKSFSSGMLNRYPKENGAYVLSLPIILKKDSWYIVSITNTHVEVDKKNFLYASNVQVDSHKARVGNNYFRLRFGDFSKTESGERLLFGSKLEDLGNRLLYTYSLSETSLDFINIFESSRHVVYNEESKAVEGRGEVGNFYTYQIHTVFPFSFLKIDARQRGDVKGRVRMEYSFDNKVWVEIDADQRERDVISFVKKIDAVGKVSTVYIRVSYGQQEDRPTKSFGLSKLSVIASLPISKN